MKISIKPLAASAIAAIVAAACPAMAGTTQTIVANGWQITYPGNITLGVVSGGSTSTLSLTKDVTFSVDQGALIAFTQVATDASSQIVFNDEHVTNDTGTSWNGFGFVLMSPFGPAAGGSFASAGQVFNPSTPFKTTTFSSDIVTLSDGVLPTGSTFEWGTALPGNGLAINAVPGMAMPTTFTFKEIPFEGGSAIPLPKAMWSALTVLGGLGTLTLVRRKRVAMV
jgi:hypothetical protein